ncbi:hypothetical protein PAPHI01_0693 [Pancytospora philotis]|nr:hypothetical protein PAPHI01_0693 [Pancytospora philotis]
MGLIGFRPKLASHQLSSVAKKGSGFFYGGDAVKEIEMCGLVLRAAPRHFTICDFFGERLCFKPQQLELPDGPCIAVLRVFARANEVALYCVQVRRAGIYEELAFQLEAAALGEQRGVR